MVKNKKSGKSSSLPAKTSGSSKKSKLKRNHTQLNDSTLIHNDPADCAIMEEARQKFLADKTALLKSHPRQWVIYHQSTQITICDNSEDAMKFARNKGYVMDECNLFQIVPSAGVYEDSIDIY